MVSLAHGQHTWKAAHKINLKILPYRWMDKINYSPAHHRFSARDATMCDSRIEDFSRQNLQFFIFPLSPRSKVFPPAQQVQINQILKAVYSKLYIAPRSKNSSSSTHTQKIKMEKWKMFFFLLHFVVGVLLIAAYLHWIIHGNGGKCHMHVILHRKKIQFQIQCVAANQKLCDDFLVANFYAGKSFMALSSPADGTRTCKTSFAANSSSLAHTNNLCVTMFFHFISRKSNE